jgi:hypothetical protein
LFCDFGRVICGDDANEFYTVINIGDVAGIRKGAGEAEYLATLRSEALAYLTGRESSDSST